MGIQIKGLDKFRSQVNSLPKIIDDGIWEANFDIVEDVEARAVAKLQSSIKYGSGELAGSLKHEVVVNQKGHIVGRVWSDDPKAIYREFGTGKNGQESPKKLPEGVNPVYTQTPWFIPADEVDIDLEAVYGMKKITINGKDFYKTSGQPARQFLTPAMDEATEHAEEIFQKRVKESIRKGLK